jgi:hypothetical protein
LWWNKNVQINKCLDKTKVVNISNGYVYIYFLLLRSYISIKISNILINTKFCAVKTLKNFWSQTYKIHERWNIFLIWFLGVFNATFNNISAISTWWPVLVVEEAGVPGENHRPWAKNVITCSCESSAPFFVIYKAGLEPTPYWW